MIKIFNHGQKVWSFYTFLANSMPIVAYFGKRSCHDWNVFEKWFKSSITAWKFSLSE